MSSDDDDDWGAAGGVDDANLQWAPAPPEAHGSDGIEDPTQGRFPEGIRPAKPKFKFGDKPPPPNLPEA